MAARAIHWFRFDLRLKDNPALCMASKSAAILPLFIWDTTLPKLSQIGGASRWWLHHSLSALNQDLGGALQCLSGDPLTLLPELLTKMNIQHISWNIDYTPKIFARDMRLAENLRKAGIFVHLDAGNYLWPPGTVKKADGSAYLVFTPFYQRGCLQNSPPPRDLVGKPRLSLLQEKLGQLDSLKLLSNASWEKKLEQYWQPGENHAHKKLRAFIAERVDRYKTARDFPAQAGTSHLSPYLHFGEISIHTVWHSIRENADHPDSHTFLSELGWREFSADLLFQNPQLPSKNLNKKFDAFPWKPSDRYFAAWKKGVTGYPIIDAGMRELWETGYMHNRVRMIVASFLVKNLLIDWRKGAKWFWDTLVDADLANNSASWQWVAGCGADAAPYFRIFNPITQAEKFDPDGSYIRRFVPELSALETPHLFKPWEAKPEVLQKANIILGKNYPHPIVDIKASRERALSAFKALK